jgi:menaquinone-9 beta-reductase
MTDVVVAGAGPAGALAALLLARQGARVRVLDRARFPRDKLCGDTLNPGALRVLARHVDVRALTARALPIEGMVLTGPGDVSVCGRYGANIEGLSLARRDFDAWLLREAIAAGARLEEGVTVLGPDVDAGVRVTGVRVRLASGATDVIRAPIVIGADGRRSALALALGLARQPRRPRRWAIGAHFESVTDLQPLGEMHVRHGRYIGVAPLPGGLANACLVEPHTTAMPAWRHPGERLRSALDSDPLLAPRFASARLVTRPVVLGPMAVDVTHPGVPGLLLAGDAAGFIDPMTGDGLRYAFVGAELAAQVAAEVLSGTLDTARAPDLLAARRRATLAGKWRFNRALRRLVAWPAGISAAALIARAAPSVFESLIRYAGDCHDLALS